MSYSDIAKCFGPQTKEQSKKSQHTQTVLASKPNAHKKNRSSGLKGVTHKQEQCVEFYVQNIHRNSDDIDKDIQKEVHDYAETKGLNILSAFIIHNKFWSDLIECKIRVPIAQKDNALDRNTLPVDIKCRV